VPTSSEDPILISARREAILVAINFVCALGYTITYCYLRGYNRTADDLQFIFGFPDWIFWGILVPWVICVAFSFLFASRLMRDEDLGEDPPAGDDELGLGG